MATGGWGEPQLGHPLGTVALKRRSNVGGGLSLTANIDEGMDDVPFYGLVTTGATFQDIKTLPTALSNVYLLLAHLRSFLPFRSSSSSRGPRPFGPPDVACTGLHQDFVRADPESSDVWTARGRVESLE